MFLMSPNLIERSNTTAPSWFLTKRRYLLKHWREPLKYSVTYFSLISINYIFSLTRRLPTKFGNMAGDPPLGKRAAPYYA